MIPLVDLTPGVGSTGIFPGTHNRYPLTYDDLAKITPALFVAPMGSVYLMDYRVQHAGMPNESDRERPVIHAIYSRPWFTDYVNYKKVLPIDIDKEPYAQVPEDLKPLFMRAAIGFED